MPTIFPIRAAAVRTFTVHREYSTEIIISRRGNEQRRALRLTPRKTIEFQAGVQIDLWRKINHALVTGQQRSWYFPDQSRATTLAAPLAAGAAPLSVTLTSTPPWLSAVTGVILFDGTNLEYHTVTAGSPPITLGIDTAITWPIGTIVFPALFGYMSSHLESTSLNEQFLDVKFTFEVDPVSEAAVTPVAADATYLDIDVMLMQPLNFVPVDMTLDQVREDIDAGQGIVTRFFPVTFPSKTWKGTYTVAFFSNQERIRSLHDRCRGRWKSFYMPTFENDLPLAAIATSGSNTLSVIGNDFFDIYGTSTIYKSVCVFLPTGETLFNTIVQSPVGIAPSGDNSTFTFANNWPTDIPIDAKVSWMPQWRFAADMLDSDFMYGRGADAKPVQASSIPFLMLEDFPIEVLDLTPPGPPTPDFATTFNASTTADTTLSTDKLTAVHNTTNGATGAKVALVDSHSTGKYYFEFDIDAPAGGVTFSQIGLMSSISNYSDVVFTNNGALTVVPTNGQLFSFMTGFANIGALTAGDRVGFAVDLDAELGWVKKIGGDWNANPTADPATGAGGQSLGTPGSLQPLVAYDFGTLNEQYTANFGASAFAGAVPSGFVAGWPKG